MNGFNQGTTNANDTTTTTTTTCDLEVLYFERTNKVHKSKGVSKFDGILSVNVTTGSIRLRDATTVENDNDGDGCSSEEDEQPANKKRTKKKKSFAQQKKKLQQNKRKAIPYSGTDKTLALKIHENGVPDEDDATIVLGGYQVQIVAAISCTNAAKKHPTTTTCTTTKRASNSLVSRKRPLGPAANNSINNKQMPSKRAFVAKPLKSVKPKSSPMPKSKLTQTRSHSRNNNNQQPVLLQRKPLPSTKNAPLHPSNKRGLVQSRSSTLQSTVAKKPPAIAIMTATKTNDTRTKPAAATTNTNNKNDVCSHIPLSGQIRTVLMSHQAEGVNFLWKALVQGGTDHHHHHHHNHTSKGAILADEMGLGKTLMTIATIVGMHRKNRDKHFIVVCPSSLVKNWANEFDKWVGKASQPKRVVIQTGKDESISRLKAINSSTKSMGGQVLILSFDIFRRVTANIQQSIGLVVVDEAHKVKNKDAQIFAALASIPADARLLITATPVQNNLKEFYTLANFVRPGCLGEASDFRREYERPIAAGYQKNASRAQQARGKERSKALDALIRPFMLRRLQKDIRNNLPPRETTLLFCRPSATQTSMYQDICRRAANASEGGALTALQTLQKLCAHPSLLDNRNHGDETQLSNPRRSSDEAVELSGKLSVLQVLLMAIRSAGDKVVIVSNYTTVLSLLEMTILRPLQLPFMRLDGSTDQKDRQSLVDIFNRKGGSGFAFLLSSKSGGCGLNLIGANRLIMVDPDWNPQSDRQAMARIYRKGQEKPCFIYRLFTTGTVEEVILQRQMTKQALEVMNGSKSNKSEKFTKEEIADCFALKQTDCDTKHKLGNSWPGYDGPASLEGQGSTDRVLLAVSEKLADILSFVRVEDETKTEAERNDLGGSNESEGDDNERSGGDLNDTEDDESSDEEMEF